MTVFPIEFDDMGRKFDPDGNVRNWWREDTITQFTAKAKCFIDQVRLVHFSLEKLKKKLLLKQFIQFLEQYSNYRYPTLNLTVSG